MAKHTFFVVKDEMGTTFASTFAAVWFAKVMDLDIEASIFRSEVGRHGSYASLFIEEAFSRN